MKRTAKNTNLETDELQEQYTVNREVNGQWRLVSLPPDLLTRTEREYFIKALHYYAKDCRQQASEAQAHLIAFEAYSLRRDAVDDARAKASKVMPSRRALIVMQPRVN